MKHPVSSNQVGVPQALPLHAPRYFLHLLHRVQRAYVVPAGELVHVAAQVLDAHLVIRPVEAALEHGPERFDTVCMRQVVHVLAYRVFDRLVLVYVLEALVSPVVVRVGGERARVRPFCFTLARSIERRPRIRRLRCASSALQLDIYVLAFISCPRIPLKIPRSKSRTRPNGSLHVLL